MISASQKAWEFISGNAIGYRFTAGKVAERAGITTPQASAAIHRFIELKAVTLVGRQFGRSNTFIYQYIEDVGYVSKTSTGIGTRRTRLFSCTSRASGLDLLSLEGEPVAAPLSKPDASEIAFHLADNASQEFHYGRDNPLLTEAPKLQEPIKIGPRLSEQLLEIAISVAALEVERDRQPLSAYSYSELWTELKRRRSASNGH